MMVAAHNLSESVVFYYGGALTLGIIVVVLIILFQFAKSVIAAKEIDEVRSEWAECIQDHISDD